MKFLVSKTVLESDVVSLTTEEVLEVTRSQKLVYTVVPKSSSFDKEARVAASFPDGMQAWCAKSVADAGGMQVECHSNQSRRRPRRSGRLSCSGRLRASRAIRRSVQFRRDRSKGPLRATQAKQKTKRRVTRKCRRRFRLRLSLTRTRRTHSHNDHYCRAHRQIWRQERRGLAAGRVGAFTTLFARYKVYALSGLVHALNNLRNKTMQR